MHISDNSKVWNLRSRLVKNPTLKSGASGSLLMHTMVWDSFIPAWCWIEPLTPHPMYSEGRITFPVWPTWRLDSSIPMSTAARVPPTTHEHRPLRPTRAPDLVRQIEDLLELLLPAHSSPSDDHARRGGQTGSADEGECKAPPDRLGPRFFHHLGVARVDRDLCWQPLHTATGRGRIDGGEHDWRAGLLWAEGRIVITCLSLPEENKPSEKWRAAQSPQHSQRTQTVGMCPCLGRLSRRSAWEDRSMQRNAPVTSKSKMTSSHR